MRMPRNPWVAIMNAADNGVGLRLTADEVGQLSMDGAIEACAANDVARVDDTINPMVTGWDKIDPKKYPINLSIPSTARATEAPLQGPKQHGWPVGTRTCDCVTGEVEPSACHCERASELSSTNSGGTAK